MSGGCPKGNLRYYNNIPYTTGLENIALVLKDLGESKEVEERL